MSGTGNSRTFRPLTVISTTCSHAMEVLRDYVIDGRPDRSAGFSQGRKCGPSHLAGPRATVSAIASQSRRTATSIEHGRQAIESRLLAMGRAHDLLLQVRWSSASLA